MLVRPTFFATLVCAVFFLVGTEADAQKAKTGPNPGAKSGAKKKKEKVSEVGDYDGVRAGASSITPPGARGKKGKNRPVAYWVGFEPRDGGSSRVFVQLGTNVGAEQWVEGNSLVVHLPKIRIGNRTVARYLNTRYFDTSIQQIRIKNARARRAKAGKPAHSSGLQLHFDFKNLADLGKASLDVQTEADGYNYLYLDFGSGTEVEESEASDE
jgi:hypothetical protein